MIKKILVLTSAFVLSLGSLFSQNNSSTENLQKRSGTPAPPQQWDDWFNGEVVKYKKKHPAGRSEFAMFSIPVIFHILHNGAALGTPPNIPAARVAAQINILNQIYGGIGANPNAITQYSSFVANPGISFCLATVNPTNIALVEPGIDRVDLGALMGANTGTITNDAQLLSFIEYTVKPAIIWDPTKYLNIFVSEISTSVSVMGSATYPSSTTLVGLGAVGTGSTDGVWVATKTVGFSTVVPGPYIANYDQGKNLAHEIGHWLGLRNIWGDANCGSDYCDDTPPAYGPNSSCPTTYPWHQNSCGPSLSPGGEMSMNMMDYTFDACRYMFTNDQVIRMQTAMSQCPFRWLLGTNGLCTNTVTYAAGPAYASFSLTAPAPCFGQAFTPVNTSTGSPTPTYTWVLTPNTATVLQGYGVAMPSFNLANQGTYTLTLTASNSLATTSQSLVFTTTPCPVNTSCLDTLDKIKKTDTLTVYSANTSSSTIGCSTNPGFLTGTNCYQDKEFAQFYAGSTYSDIPGPQLSSVLVLFNKPGTKSNSGTSNVSCNLWGGTFAGGPVSLLTQNATALSNITSSVVATWSTMASPTNSVPWCGTSTYTFASKVIYPYKFSFNPPYILPTSGFHVGIEMPWTSASDSAQIFSNTLLNAPISDSSVSVRTFNNNWYKLFKLRGKNVQLAIIPQITCRAQVGIEVYANELQTNINLMPNPNNGKFNILTTFSKEQDLTFKIFNYLGEIMALNKESNVTNRMFDIDLSNQPNGVYFIEISNGTQKTVKKIVINK